MNIELSSSNLKKTGTDEYGKFFVLQDSIGFSTADEVEGFNRSFAGDDDGLGGTYPEYRDVNNVPYPKIGNTVMPLIVYRNTHYSNDVEVIPLNLQIVRDPEPGIDEEDNIISVDYSTYAYNHEIPITEDGWYTVYAFLIESLDSSLVTIPSQGVYYDTATSSFIDGASSSVIEVTDLLDREDVQVIDLQFFETPKAQISLNNFTGKLADEGVAKGNCSKEYKRLQNAVFFYENQLSGAYVKFNEAYYNNAQQIIEDLNNSNPYGDC